MMNLGIVSYIHNGWQMKMFCCVSNDIKAIVKMRLNASMIALAGYAYADGTEWKTEMAW